MWGRMRRQGGSISSGDEILLSGQESHWEDFKGSIQMHLPMLDASIECEIEKESFSCEDGGMRLGRSGGAWVDDVGAVMATREER